VPIDPLELLLLAFNQVRYFLRYRHAGGNRRLTANVVRAAALSRGPDVMTWKVELAASTATSLSGGVEGVLAFHRTGVAT
jgi:hypothetical protein